MKTITLAEWETQYFNLKQYSSDYRYGQHFINTFIKSTDTEDDFLSKLWNERDIDKARTMVYSLLEDYSWDLQSLIVLELNK